MTLHVGMPGFIKQGGRDVLAIVTGIEKEFVHVAAFPPGYTPHAAKVPHEEFITGEPKPAEGPSEAGSSDTSTPPTE